MLSAITVFWEQRNSMLYIKRRKYLNHFLPTVNTRIRLLGRDRMEAESLKFSPKKKHGGLEVRMLFGITKIDRGKFIRTKFICNKIFEQKVT